MPRSSLSSASLHLLPWKVYPSAWSIFQLRTSRFYYWTFKSPSHILHKVLLSCGSSRYILWCVSWLCIDWLVFWREENVLILVNPTQFLNYIMGCASELYPRNLYLTQGLENVAMVSCSFFSPKSGLIWVFIFKPVIYLELMFVYNKGCNREAVHFIYSTLFF